MQNIFNLGRIYVEFNSLQIRRFWSRNIVGNLKKFCIAFKGSDSAQHSASVSRVATGRYIAVREL